MSYMLFNSTHFYVSSYHKNIIKSNDVAASDFPEQVEEFLKVSCDTTHFLENYVQSLLEMRNGYLLVGNAVLEIIGAIIFE